MPSMTTVKNPNQRKPPKGDQQYKGNGKHDWEDVTEDSFTRRLRVPGGWLYIDTKYESALVFVPVPEVVGYKV
jgi:hypothetical protein